MSKGINTGAIGGGGGGASDTTAPSVATFTATSPSGLTIAITAFTASEVGASFIITESSTPPASGAAGWSGTAPTTYAVETYGDKTLYPWVKDAAGNVSSVYGSPVAVSVTYIAQVLSIQTANLCAYWPLNEAAGATADNIEGTAARDGTYSAGVELNNALGPDGVNNAPLFGTDYCGIGTTSLNTAIGNKQELTIACWVKVGAVGVWTDGTLRQIMALYNGSGNRINMEKSLTNNRLSLYYAAGGTAKQVDINSLSTTDWFHLAITASLSGDAMKVYINGAQTGATQTGLGTWVGDLLAIRTNIGSFDQVPSQTWSGWLAHAAVWKVALTPTEVAALANPT